MSVLRRSLRNWAPRFEESLADKHHDHHNRELYTLSFLRSANLRAQSLVSRIRFPVVGFVTRKPQGLEKLIPSSKVKDYFFNRNIIFEGFSPLRLSGEVWVAMGMWHWIARRVDFPYKDKIF